VDDHDGRTDHGTNERDDEPIDQRIDERIDERIDQRMTSDSPDADFKGRFRVLVVATLVGLVVRLVYVALLADFDGDAYAHYEFACHVHPHPSDLRVHWIWLPGFHFALAAMQKIGCSFRSVRIFNALLCSVGPWLLLRYARIREKDDDGPRVASDAALLLAVSSLMTVLGTAALAEMPFTLSILAAATMLDEERPIPAGGFLTIAASMRYEAWFVVMIMGLLSLVPARAAHPHRRTLFIAAAIPSAVIVLYIMIRGLVTDPEWLWFIRETYRFTHMQRNLSTASPIFDVLWFPVILPFFVIGPALVLIPLGGRWKRPSSVIPIALLLFLALTYLGRGALGQARYLTVLVPFACYAMARGLNRWRKKLPYLPALTTLSVLVTAIIFIINTGRSAARRSEDLRAREDRANATCVVVPPK
jgi:hypothetical protein